MKKKMAIAFCLIILSTFFYTLNISPEISAQPEDSTETLYGVVAWEGSLVTIDTSTGEASVVGNTGLMAPCALAYAPNRGLLYAVECYGGGILYTLDLETATASAMPDSDWSFGQGLAYRQVDDALYSPSFSTREVAKIDPDTGSLVQIIGEIGAPGELIVLGALSVRPSDGTLFAGGFRVATDLLFTLSTTPGTTPLETEVGPTNRLISSMAFHPNGTLYASDGDYLFTINPSTGEVTEIGAFGDDIGFVAGLTFVTPPIPGPIDIWIKDCEEDNGDTPSVPTPCNVAYKSPDIWIDNNEDMIIDAPVIGVDNTLRALVRNRDTGTAENVEVDFYYRDNTTGLVFPNGATHMGNDTVTVPPNGTAVASITWENLPAPPTSGGHWCIGVVLNHPEDPAITPAVPARDDNNVAIANIWYIAGREGERKLLDFNVGTGGGSGFGLTPWPRDFIVEVNDRLPVGWNWSLEGIPVEQPFIMKLGEERAVKLLIDVPDGASPHSGGEIEVRQVDVATGTVVGGVHFNLYEDHHPPQAVRTLTASLVDGNAVLTWEPVVKEADTNLRERVAYYEIIRNGEPAVKVVRDGDPQKPGIQWTDPIGVEGEVTYTIRVVDEGGNASVAAQDAVVKGPIEGDLFNWLTWLLLVLLLLVIIILILLRRRPGGL